jgi:hypothetical protein
MKFICKIALMLNFAFFSLSVFSSRASAQEMPNDYQNVLKSLDRKGDFKGGGSEGEYSAQRFEDDHPGLCHTDTLWLRGLDRIDQSNGRV